MKIGIVGPHGSGNRLLRRITEHAFDDAECAVRTFPVKNPANWNSEYLLRKDFIPDHVFVTLREAAPYSMVREKRAKDINEAKKMHMDAYAQINEAIPEFWKSDDVTLVRYSDLLITGACDMINVIAERTGLTANPQPFNEMIEDGDTKYGVTIKYWSRWRWVNEIEKRCQRASS